MLNAPQFMKKDEEVVSGRWLEFVFGLSSLISLIITAIVTIFTALEGDYGTQPSVVIFSLAVVNLALAVVCVVLVRRSGVLYRDNALLRPKNDTLNERIKDLDNRINQNNSNFSEIADIWAPCKIACLGAIGG